MSYTELMSIPYEIQSALAMVIRNCAALKRFRWLKVTLSSHFCLCKSLTEIAELGFLSKILLEESGN